MSAERGSPGGFRPRGAGVLTPALMLAICLTLAPAGVLADTKQYRFTNNTGRAVDDLHIEWKNAVSWTGAAPTQVPAGTFAESKGSGSTSTGFAAGLTGTGVPAGGNVVMDFDFSGSTPKIKSARWTISNTTEPKAKDYHGNALRATELSNAWASAPAAGDGVLLVSIPGETPMKFGTTPGDPPEVTAQKFAGFIADIPFGEVLELAGPSVLYTSRSFDSAGDNITVEIVLQDSLQPVQVQQFASYLTGFESPPIKGDPLGVPIHMQDGWYTVNDPPSGDGQVYAFAGNVPEFPPLPGGTDQFLVTAQGAVPARAQRDNNFSAFDIVSFRYDTASKFIGAVPPTGLTDFMNSFSLQPSTTARFFIQINVWQDKVGGTTWSAGYLVAAEPPGSPVIQTVAAIQFPGPEWMNIPVDKWVTLETLVSFSQNRILGVAITDPETNERVEFFPTDWYLDGGSAPSKPLPTSVRLFSGNNLGNHTGWDNFFMHPEDLDEPCYPDCDGNGQLNIDDFICFQLAFALQNPYADCDGNQVFNIDDFICFQLAFALGC